MSDVSPIVGRLIAHARICREIAGATWNEVTAAQLDQLAAECLAAAREADRQSRHDKFLHCEARAG